MMKQSNLVLAMRDGWIRRRVIWYIKKDLVAKWRAKRSGECTRCGRCCGSCPLFDERDNRCRIYKMRPDICKAFPLTPEDLKNLLNCGFKFEK